MSVFEKNQKEPRRFWGKALFVLWVLVQLWAVGILSL